EPAGAVGAARAVRDTAAAAPAGRGCEAMDRGPEDDDGAGRLHAAERAVLRVHVVPALPLDRPRRGGECPRADRDNDRAGDLARPGLAGGRRGWLRGVMARARATRARDLRLPAGPRHRALAAAPAVAAAHAGGLGVSGPERWLLSPHVGVEAADESSVVVFHGATGARLRLSKPLYEVLRAFRNPAAPAEALGRRDFAAARRCLETLRAKGFLVLADAGGRTAGVGGEVPARPVAPSPYTMFRGSPRGPGAWPAHAAVIGVPSDLGADAAGARDAPAAVRRRSAEFVYECDFDTCRPRGWFDVDRGERILAGV